jgi:hypothetical protein
VAPPPSSLPSVARSAKEGATAGVPADSKPAVLAAIREGNKALYSMVIAQAQKVDFEGDNLVMTFAPAHKALKGQLEGKRAWIEQLAKSITGRTIKLVTKDGEAAPPAPKKDDVSAARHAELKARAKAAPTVQAVLDVFGGEVDTVEEDNS